MIINKFHQVMLGSYRSGKFSRLGNETEITTREISNLGDILLMFLMVELSSKEYCHTADDALCRLTRGRDELDACVVAMDAINKATLNLTS